MYDSEFDGEDVDTLRARIDELEADLAAEKRDRADNIRDLTNRVLAADAREKRLQEALEGISKMGSICPTVSAVPLISCSAPATAYVIANDPGKSASQIAWEALQALKEAK